MRQEKASHVPAGSIPVWSVTLFYPETRVKSSTLHSAGTRGEAVGKALQFVPSFATPPKVRRAVIEDYYTSKPHDLVI
jgi:hypothetical protein